MDVGDLVEIGRVGAAPQGSPTGPATNVHSQRNVGSKYAFFVFFFSVWKWNELHWYICYGKVRYWSKTPPCNQFFFSYLFSSFQISPEVVEYTINWTHGTLPGKRTHHKAIPQKIGEKLHCWCVPFSCRMRPQKKM